MNLLRNYARNKFELARLENSNMRSLVRGKNSLIVAAAAALISMCAVIEQASAYTHRTLHDFCYDGLPCADGYEPDSKLTVDPAGNLFGTTTGGGTGQNNQGVAFELVNRGGGRWKYKVIHNFCSVGDCTDGGFPTGLIAAVDGSLYGTTANGGGGSHEGVAFKLVPNKSGTKYKFVVLYAFCSQQDCADGGTPVSDLTYAGASSGAFYDGASPLYGISGYGGGAVFELRRDKGWKESIVYQFCSKADCSDGGSPMELVVDSIGKTIFGVTDYGGAAGGASGGVLFRLNFKNKTWSEDVLYDFCDQAPCVNGNAPRSLTADGTGNLYGATAVGGDANQGVAFRFEPTTMQYVRLYSFCAQAGCTDGGHPVGLSIDGSGKIFGATNQGGTGQFPSGVIFSLIGGNERVLYNFCSLDDCADGHHATSGVAIGEDGNLYGATGGGGAYDSGTVYVLKP